MPMLDATTSPAGLFTDDREVTRCVWCRATLPYQQYHDQEGSVAIRTGDGEEARWRSSDQKANP